MIIIETPTTTRERLVLVPPGAVREPLPGEYRKPGCFVVGTGEGRAATPADLERGGFAPLSAFVGPLDLLSPPTLAGALEAIGGIQKDADRWEGELATVKRDYADIQRQLGEERERAEKAEATLAMHGRPTYVEAVERAEKAERERDEALLRAHTGVVHYEILRQSGEEAARQRDEARAEVARLTAPGEGSCWACREELGVADERARQQPAKDRATDEELAQVYRKIYETHGGGTISVSHDDCRRAGVRAVAARVRQERCLVAEAVGMGTGVTISRTSERVPSTTGMWDVYVTRRPDVPGEHYAYGVPTADVPATLARLLGEVSRG